MDPSPVADALQVAQLHSAIAQLAELYGAEVPRSVYRKLRHFCRARVNFEIVVQASGQVLLNPIQ